MELNKIKNLSILIIFAFCFITHFIYDYFPSFFTSLFFPINESVWEHMKMLTSSIIIWEFILYFILRKNNYHIKNFFLNVLCVCLCSVFIFLILYYSLYPIIGDNFIINIILLFVAIFISVNIGFKILNNDNYSLELLSFIGIIIIYIIFGVFTYYPPKNTLFIDPINKKYGINFD